MNRKFEKSHLWTFPLFFYLFSLASLEFVESGDPTNSSYDSCSKSLDYGTNSCFLFSLSFPLAILWVHTCKYGSFLLSSHFLLLSSSLPHLNLSSCESWRLSFYHFRQIRASKNCNFVVKKALLSLVFSIVASSSCIPPYPIWKHPFFLCCFRQTRVFQKPAASLLRTFNLH